MHTSKLTKCLTKLSSLITTLSGGANCKFTQLVDIQISAQCGCIHTGYKQEGLLRQLKINHIDFAVLNSHVKVIYLKIYQKHFFSCTKTEKN